MGKVTAECDCGAIHEEIVAKVKKTMPEDEHISDISDFFRIFSDTTRIKILWALDESEMCVCDISALLGMTKSAVSHQLKVLKDNNLVKFRKEGKAVFYSLSDSHVRDIFERAVEHINE